MVDWRTNSNTVTRSVGPTLSLFSSVGPNLKLFNLHSHGFSFSVSSSTSSRPARSSYNQLDFPLGNHSSSACSPKFDNRPPVQTRKKSEMAISSCLRLTFPVIRRSLDLPKQNAPCLGSFESLRPRRPTVLRPRLRSTVTCFSRRPAESTVSGEEKEIVQEEESQQYELERLFSNLNQVTLKREPGDFSVPSAYLIRDSFENWRRSFIGSWKLTVVWILIPLALGFCSGSAGRKLIQRDFPGGWDDSKHFIPEFPFSF